MQKKLLNFTVVALLSIGLVACSEKEEATPKEATTVAIETVENMIKVDLKASNYDFNVKEIYAKVGDAIEITLSNESGLHGVEVADFGTLQAGETLTFVVTEPGEYTYFCNIPCGPGHADMVGKIIVG